MEMGKIIIFEDGTVLLLWENNYVLYSKILKLIGRGWKNGETDTYYNQM